MLGQPRGGLSGSHDGIVHLGTSVYRVLPDGGIQRSTKYLPAFVFSHGRGVFQPFLLLLQGIAGGFLLLSYVSEVFQKKWKVSNRCRNICRSLLWKRVLPFRSGLGLH
jgi:hypothetical protein